MKRRRSASFVLIASLGVLFALPISVAAYAGNHMPSVALPSFHSQVEGQTVALTPISEEKAKAIRSFKLAQI